MGPLSFGSQQQQQRLSRRKTACHVSGSRWRSQAAAAGATGREEERILSVSEDAMLRETELRLHALSAGIPFGYRGFFEEGLKVRLGSLSLELP